MHVRTIFNLHTLDVTHFPIKNMYGMERLGGIADNGKNITNSLLIIFTLVLRCQSLHSVDSRS